jgi:hypothetical protein
MHTREAESKRTRRLMAVITFEIVSLTIMAAHVILTTPMGR